MDDTILVHTSRSIERMLDEGGSQAWSLKLTRARQMRYVVCAWFPGGPYAEVADRHVAGEGMMVAEIERISPSAEEHSVRNRYIIRFKRWARLSHGVMWSDERNPVKYTSLAALGIDPTALDWQNVDPKYEIDPNSNIVPMDMAHAKFALAMFYKVRSENVEITIRG